MNKLSIKYINTHTLVEKDMESSKSLMLLYQDSRNTTANNIERLKSVKQYIPARTWEISDVTGVFPVTAISRTGKYVPGMSFTSLSWL